MKLNNRNLHVHDIVLDMRETYNKGTLLEVFGEKRLSSIAISVNIFLFWLCSVHWIILYFSLQNYIWTRKLWGKKKKASIFLDFHIESDTFLYLSFYPGCLVLHYSRSQLWGIRKQEKDDNINISIKLTVLLTLSK